MAATCTTAIRAVVFAAALGAPPLLGTGVAGAAPGHTSCRDLGTTTAGEAQAHELAPEILSFAPGSVDDLVALAQLGGTFDGEVVPPLCQPK